ncbi:MAG: DNRLRE domain-containing protein, partial [Bacteroidia bacterium]|nr:DNRLRE domain-containing protein [Bacteroidia bacterium]
MKKTTYCVRAAVVAFIFLFSISTYSQSTQTVDFIATKDAYLRGKPDGEQTKNFGDCNDLRVKNKPTDLKRILLQFDISSIPSNSYIESAELRLNSTDDKDMTVSVFQIGDSDSWDEGNLCGNTGSSNWNNRTSGSSWSSPGVVGNNYDDGTPIATINAAYKGIQSWFITSLVQDWVSGIATNNGVMLGGQDGKDEEAKYESTDAGDPNPPTLRVTYRTVYDNDNDGVYNQLDIDDDNDGILDTDECSSLTDPPLLNANFEDLDILTLDDGPTDVVGTDGIWKGDASNIPNWLSADTANNYLEIWHNSQRAGNDSGGQAYSGTHWAEINATTNDGLYQDIASTPGTVLQWTFAHRKRTGYSGSANEDIAELLIGDPSGTMTSQGTFTSAGDSSWTMHTGQYVVPAGQTTTRLTFTVIQTASGSTSSGNFIDQVQLYAIPSGCEDFDGDSV